MAYVVNFRRSSNPSLFLSASTKIGISLRAACTLSIKKEVDSTSVDADLSGEHKERIGYDSEGTYEIMVRVVTDCQRKNTPEANFKG